MRRNHSKGLVPKANLNYYPLARVNFIATSEDAIARRLDAAIQIEMRVTIRLDYAEKFFGANAGRRADPQRVIDELDAAAGWQDSPV